LASDYDRLVGDALFPVIRDSFEWAVDRLGLRFESAADVGCGTGTFLGYLLGYRVPLIGVDRSPAMLGVAAKRLRGTGVRLLLQDVRALELPQPVDLITCNGNTLNYLLAESDLIAVLTRIRNHLRAGGYLIADLLTGAPEDTARPAVQTWLHSGTRASRWRARSEPRRGLTRVDVDLGRRTGRGWRWGREVHVQRWWPLARLRLILDRVGLRLLALRCLQGSLGGSEAAAWVKLVAVRP